MSRRIFEFNGVGVSMNKIKSLHLLSFVDLRVPVLLVTNQTARPRRSMKREFKPQDDNGFVVPEQPVRRCQWQRTSSGTKVWWSAVEQPRKGIVLQGGHDTRVCRSWHHESGQL